MNKATYRWCKRTVYPDIAYHRCAWPAQPSEGMAATTLPRPIRRAHQERPAGLDPVGARSLLLRPGALANRNVIAEYTQEGLAEAMGVNRTTIGRRERRKQRPQPWQHPDLAHELCVTLEQLDDVLRPQLTHGDLTGDRELVTATDRSIPALKAARLLRSCNSGEVLENPNAWPNRLVPVTGSTQQMTHAQAMNGDGARRSAERVDEVWHRPMPAAVARRSAVTWQAALGSRPDDLPTAVRTVLTWIAVGDHVTSAAFADALLATVDLPAPSRDVVLGSLMTAVMTRGPVADDVEALLRGALSVDSRASAETISGDDRPVLMLAGSGKKGVRTVNVSTPAALVAAAAGARVIKVGSAATSSALGSRDLVRALGLREHGTADGVRADLAASGFAFVAIEPEIPGPDELYGGRFHVPNPFSFGLAPLASPVRGDVTVLGLPIRVSMWRRVC